MGGPGDVLWLATILRFVRYWPRVRADLLDHGRAPGFFTVVAGTSVLGAQLLVLGAGPGAPWALWFATLALWAVVTYGFFAIVTVKQDKPPIETGLNGAWLIAVVATQSVPVLGALLARATAPELSGVVPDEMVTVPAPGSSRLKSNDDRLMVTTSPAS